MIELTTSPIAVNPSTAPTILREHIWQAFVWKSERADLFVDAIIRCQVLQRLDDGFLREIEHRTPGGTETVQERIYLQPQQRISFLRLGGRVPGIIYNLLDDSEPLTMRFAFCLALEGAVPGSAEETAFGHEFLDSYATCTDALLSAARHYAATGQSPAGIS